MLEELVSTEENYVEDLHCVLFGYRDRLDEAGEEFSLASPEVGTHRSGHLDRNAIFLSRFAITGQLYAENGFNNL